MKCTNLGRPPPPSLTSRTREYLTQQSKNCPNQPRIQSFQIMKTFCSKLLARSING